MSETLSYYIEKAESAREYASRQKTHTAVIIVQGIVSFLQDNSNFAKFLSENDGKDVAQLMFLLNKVKSLMNIKCRKAHDVSILANLKESFQKLLQDHEIALNVDENFEDESDNTECSCDDCHNHTCSSYGPLGGCRCVRTRD